MKITRRPAKELVLLVLLTDAENLAAWPIADITGLATWRVARILDQLEDAGDVTCSCETGAAGRPRRCCYRLTRSGRIWAQGQLGLKPRTPDSESP